MVINKIYDVIVIGAGPAGSVVAKKCAEHGLRTLILEKRKLPRDKVCSGILFSRLAKELVEKEFGKLPQKVIVANLLGFILWVPNIGQRKILFDMPITWRKDLDYWMNQRAKEKGVEIWEGTTVKKVSSSGNKCKVTLQKDKVEQELEARFVVGADGATSVTRKSLFPELKVAYSTAYRECYQGSLNLEKGFSYIVFPHQQYRPNFWINPKGDCFTLEGGLKELKGKINGILADYGFGDQKLLWKDGCFSRALLFKQLSSGSFTPVKENVLLVGDAAGLKIPISGEGINTAIKSGVLAANAIVEATKTGQVVSKLYISELSHLLAALTSCYAQVEEIGVQASKGSQTFLDALAMVFEESVNTFDL